MDSRYAAWISSYSLDWLFFLAWTLTKGKEIIGLCWMAIARGAFVTMMESPNGNRKLIVCASLTRSCFVGDRSTCPYPLCVLPLHVAVQDLTVGFVAGCKFIRGNVGEACQGEGEFIE